MCFLVGSLPNGLVFRHELTNDRSTIGRLGISTILLEEESISALHAELIPMGNRKYLLRDLRSKNGTTVDGQKVSEAEIKAPCHLVFGHLSCELQSCDNETCMEHGKAHPPKFGSGLIQRPLPAPGAGRPSHSAPPSRNRSSRPLSRKHRTKKLPGARLSLDDSATVVLSAPVRRDTSADAFPAPRRHAGDRAFNFSPKLLALGASVLFFAVFAMGYTGARRVPSESLAAGDLTPAVKDAVPDAATEQPADVDAPSAIPVNAPPPAFVATAVLENQGPEAANFATPGLDETDVAPIAEPGATLSTAGEPTGAEEAASPPVPGLLAVATRPETVDPLSAEPPFTPETPDTAPPPAVALGALHPRRPWEFASAQESDLALNGFAHKGAPWSFTAGGLAGGEGDLASLFHRPVVPKIAAPSLPSAAPALSVMILGDSLALCGFGSRLDRHFREATNVRATNTYMACGTTPLSWLKEKSSNNLKAYCGFWTIESPKDEGSKPMALQDTYGMPRGNKPKAHQVPKLEDLVEKTAPDILIVQTGTNLFSLFRDGQTVSPERHGPMLRRQIQPFLSGIGNLPNAPRRIYWVASPTSGRVSKEIQEFVLKQVTDLAATAAPKVTVIDSRKLVAYPYKHMEPDKEHFTGADMDQWADRVFDIVQKDLAARPPREDGGVEATRIVPPHEKEEATGQEDELRVVAKLVWKSKPISLSQLRPYNESMISFVYEVQQVTQGEYSQKKIVVMRPAHFGRTLQNLPDSTLGKTYNLRLHDLENSPWNTVKSSYDLNLIDLPLYMQVEDELKFPLQARP